MTTETIAIWQSSKDNSRFRQLCLLLVRSSARFEPLPPPPVLHSSIPLTFTPSVPPTSSDVTRCKGPSCSRGFSSNDSITFPLGRAPHLLRGPLFIPCHSLTVRSCAAQKQKDNRERLGKTYDRFQYFLKSEKILREICSFDGKCVFSTG